MVGVIIFSQWYGRGGMFLFSLTFWWGRIAFLCINKVEGRGGMLPGKTSTFWTSEMLVFGILVGCLRYHVPPPPKRRLPRAWLIYSSLKMDMQKAGMTLIEWYYLTHKTWSQLMPNSIGKQVNKRRLWNTCLTECVVVRLLSISRVNDKNHFMWSAHCTE